MGRATSAYEITPSDGKKQRGAFYLRPGDGGVVDQARFTPGDFRNQEAALGENGANPDVLYQVTSNQAKDQGHVSSGVTYRLEFSVSENGGVIELDESVRGSTVVDAVRGSFFLSETTGWIALTGGRILFTTDGATTRTDLNPTGLAMTPGPLFFFDTERGLMLVSYRDSGAIVVTRDGGRSWSKKVNLGEGPWSELFVLDEEHAWVAGTTKGDVVVRSFAPR